MDEGGGTKGERATGTANTIYDLSSVLYHSLEGGASYDQYIHDAEEAGDEELVEFFRRVSDEDSMRADEAQRLLAERTPTTAAPTQEGAAGRPTEGVTGEPPPLEEPRGAARALRTEEAPPTRAGEVPPRTEPAGAPSRREEDDRGLLDRARDELFGRGEEEPRRESPGARREEPHRREPPRGPQGNEPLR
jgi:hypothetical protein